MSCCKRRCQVTICENLDGPVPGDPNAIYSDWTEWSGGGADIIIGASQLSTGTNQKSSCRLEIARCVLNGFSNTEAPVYIASLDSFGPNPKTIEIDSTVFLVRAVIEPCAATSTQMLGVTATINPN